jgi:Serpin (serine protease inhibitor)
VTKLYSFNPKDFIILFLLRKTLVFHPNSLSYFVFHLQSYFYKKENLLSGLIFNKDNITIRPEYETVLRFYGYDLEGATNMLTESKMNETVGNMTSTTEATEIAISTTENEEDTTTLQPETSDTTDEVSGTEETTEDNAQTDDVNEDVTTVAPPARKRRGRLERGLKTKNRRDRKQQTIKSPLNRRSRSYYVLLDEDYDNEFHLESPTPTVSPLGPTSTEHNPISSPRPTISKYRNTHPKDLFDNVNSDTVEHIFYLNDYDTVRVPFKIYDSVMKYAHVDSLEASVLEIDLDTDYYNLIIIVPDHHDGLSDLTNKLRLHEASTLRRIRNAMEFHWVKTIVPKFNLKGNTILTNDLQNVS